MPVTAVTHQEMSAKKDDIRLRSNSEFPSTKKTSIGSPRSQHIGSRKTAQTKSITHSYANVNFIKIPEAYKILAKPQTSHDEETDISMGDLRRNFPQKQAMKSQYMKQLKETAGSFKNSKSLFIKEPSLAHMNALSMAEKHNSQQMEKQIEQILSEHGFANSTTNQIVDKISHKVLNKKRKISNLSVTSPRNYETQQNFQKKLDVASV